MQTAVVVPTTTGTLRGHRRLDETSYRIWLDFEDLCWSFEPSGVDLEITLLECDSNDQRQGWYHDPNTGTIQSTYTNVFTQDMCVTNNVGDVLTLSECDGQIDQTWYYVGGLFHPASDTGLCISRCRHARSDVSDFMETTACDQSHRLDQMFQTGNTMFSGGWGNGNGAGFCLRFMYPADDPKCLYFDPNDGFRMKRGECTGAFNEFFYFDGDAIKIRDALGQFEGWCVVAGSATNPIMTVSQNCNGLDRRWTYDNFHFVSKMPSPDDMCISADNNDDLISTKICSNALAYEQDFIFM